MPVTQKCPFCQSSKLISGRFMGEGVQPQGLFAPDNLEVPFWKFAPRTIAIGPDAVLCLECGMAWGKADPEQAKQEVRDFATAELKSRLLEGD